MINHLGRLFVTSDAATIIREIEVVHPAAKLLVMASQAQESEVSLSSLRSSGSPRGLRATRGKERTITSLSTLALCQFEESRLGLNTRRASSTPASDRFFNSAPTFDYPAP